VFCGLSRTFRGYGYWPGGLGLDRRGPDKSRRVVPLVPLAVEALARHRDRQAVERLTAPRYAAHDFVFADGAGEPWRADGVYKYFWLRSLARLNLPRVRLYDARHSCATMLLESGAPMRVVQEVLGHASMVLTADTYSHVSPAFKRQAADALAEYLGGARTSGGQNEGEIS
jgi:integrase